MVISGIISFAAWSVFIWTTRRQMLFYERAKFSALCLAAQVAGVLSLIEFAYRFDNVMAALEDESNFSVHYIVTISLLACTGILLFLLADDVPYVEMYRDWRRISYLGPPCITYRLFKQMTALHSNNFRAEVTSRYPTLMSLQYRGEKFTLSFVDYVRVVWLIDRMGYCRDGDGASDRLYKLMREDLAHDADVLAGHKSAALEEIERGARASGDIMSRLEKFDKIS